MMQSLSRCSLFKSTTMASNKALENGRANNRRAASAERSAAQLAHGALVRRINPLCI